MEGQRRWRGSFSAWEGHLEGGRQPGVGEEGYMGIVKLTRPRMPSRRHQLRCYPNQGPGEDTLLVGE